MLLRFFVMFSPCFRFHSLQAPDLVLRVPDFVTYKVSDVVLQMPDFVTYKVPDLILQVPDLVTSKVPEKVPSEVPGV